MGVSDLDLFKFWGLGASGWFKCLGQQSWVILVGFGFLFSVCLSGESKRPFLGGRGEQWRYVMLFWVSMVLLVLMAYGMVWLSFDVVRLFLYRTIIECSWVGSYELNSNSSNFRNFIDLITSPSSFFMLMSKLLEHFSLCDFLIQYKSMEGGWSTSD